MEQLIYVGAFLTLFITLPILFIAAVVVERQKEKE
ncbi:hypothetical protein Bcell_2091 [Evansella cellulosilytica DSM 2522]|uniref:Uncharacterized protein n=1 Tax=Evansella cellulosilytica (strain ATCC 21833 / DSM 2522 / FERM P-1141 / JCM 9156 / N-4) TaxID=649639 RepID=E6U1I9_EVAC2|nr:hypothetical protein Bcell_2091 [Evansella cellulosilytica DSM 2522]